MLSYCKIDLLPDAYSVRVCLWAARVAVCVLRNGGAPKQCLFAIFYRLMPEVIDAHINSLPEAEMKRVINSLLFVTRQSVDMKLYPEVSVV